MKAKCEIIPVSVYDGISEIAFEDENHRYLKGHNGHYIRRRKKTCSFCCKSALFVGFSNTRVTRELNGCARYTLPISEHSQIHKLNKSKKLIPVKRS